MPASVFGPQAPPSSLDGPPPLPHASETRGNPLRTMGGEREMMPPEEEGGAPVAGQSSIEAIMQKHMFVESRLQEIATILPGFAPFVDEIRERLRMGISQALNQQAGNGGMQQQQSPLNSLAGMAAGNPSGTA